MGNLNKQKLCKQKLLGALQLYEGVLRGNSLKATAPVEKEVGRGAAKAGAGSQDRGSKY